MKLAAFIAVAFILCILPNESKAKGKKPKPAKFCMGENGKRYAKGKGYEDKEACKSYTCVKQGKKLKMKETKIPCSGSEGKPTHGGDGTASIQFLNASMEAMESKIHDLQTSLESLSEKMIAMQTTSDNYESCLADVCSAIQGPQSEYNLVVTGGRTFTPLATSEIISPGGVCDQVIPPLPVAITNPESAYFNNSLYICGGSTDGGFSTVQNKCYQLRDAISQWTEGPTMKGYRTGFTLTSVGQDLYALGGMGSEADDYMGSFTTIEKLSVSSREWTLMDLKLTLPRSMHCTIFMEKTNSLIIIGGYTNPVEHVGMVEEFHLSTGTFTQLSPLPAQWTLNNPYCAVLDDAVVVIGGSAFGHGQKEVYTFAEGQWKITGELTVPRYGHVVGVLDNKLLAIGGSSGGYGSHLDSIEEMQRNGSSLIMPWKLKEKREMCGIAKVPRQLFPCM